MFVLVGLSVHPDQAREPVEEAVVRVEALQRRRPPAGRLRALLLQRQEPGRGALPCRHMATLV
jgi:hypothetical protein